MNGKDALAQQYGLFYRVARMNLDGFTADSALRQPAEGGNCANWILGHVLRAQNGVMRLVNESPVWDRDEIERYRTDPIESADEALDWDAMVSSLLDSEERFMTALGALSTEQLEEDGFTDPFGGETTRGLFLNLLAMHQNYHVGQLGLSRRLVGLDGALRAP